MFAPKCKMVVMSLKIYSAEKIETQKPSSLNSYKTALSYNKNFRGKKASEYTCQLTDVTKKSGSFHLSVWSY